MGGRPDSASSYFTGKGSIPWWASSLSIVATETSILTIISTPAIAYSGNLTFLQLILGYVVGRIFVAFFIIPKYFLSTPESTYTFLGNRFGSRFRKLISLTFLATRLLADGVRLFAAAIPIKILTGWGYTESILLITALTLAYTFLGGIRSVIWMDVIQWFIYVFGGFFILGIIFFHDTSPEWTWIPEKLDVFAFDLSIQAWLTQPYQFITAFVGGIFLTLASHGTDHLIVQRLLACKNEREAQKALLSSGLVVFMQFTLFLGVGYGLFVFFKGQAFSDLGLSRGDELIPYFIANYVPVGFRGLLIAGLLAAAMSTLSSSLSALSSSTLFDLFPKKAQHISLTQSRLIMLFWAMIFTFFASSFTDFENPIIELGLGIAGFTYGAMLGAIFASGISFLNANGVVPALLSTILIMIFIITQTPLAWPWYTFVGATGFTAFSVIFQILSRVTAKV